MSHSHGKLPTAVRQAHAASPAPVPTAGDTHGAVHFETLANGLTLLLRESHLAPVAELQIWARVGSADEGPGEAGLAHFHEHMLFKGTPRRGVGAIAGDIEGAGGRINAYTSFDVTVYHATLPADRVATGAEVLFDAVLHSSFEPDEIAREIEVVLEEIRRSEDSPFHVLGDAVFREAYRVHPYRWPILGTPESVASFDRERVTRFFERWYAPDNLLFVAVGDFDARQLAQQVRALTAAAQPAGAVRARPAEPDQCELRPLVFRRPFERVRMDLSWAGCAFRDPHATHLELLSFLLGECESSRLVQQVKERDGVVDRIDSGSYTPLDAGLFSVTIEADCERARDAVVATVREVERLRRRPVGRDELERARTNFLASEHFERESVGGQARKLGSFQVLAGDWRAEAEYLDTIRRATPDDLLAAAQHFLAPDRLTAGVMLPEGETPALDADALRDAVAEGLAAAERSTLPARRRSPATGASSAPDPAAPLEYALPGGAALHVLPRHDIPVVAARAAFLGGQLIESEPRAGLSRFLSACWLRGTQSRSAAGLARSIENLAADLDSFSGRNSLGLSLECTRDVLEPALDLFAEVLREPDFDPEEIERERRETLAAIARREDRLAQLAYLLFARTLFERHPYRLPLAGERESVEGFDGETLREAHTQLVRSDNLVVAVAGDVDPDALADGLSARLSELPGGDSRPQVPEPEPAPAAIREAFLAKERAQTHLVLGFQGTTVLDPDRFALEVASQLLAGQGGRLFLELRDRRSLAYSVNALNVEGVAPGTFSIYIATAPDKSAEAQRRILEELERLRQERVPEDELERARRHLIGNFAIEQQRCASHAAHMSLDALYGLGADAERHYAAQVAAVGADDLLRVAQRFLRLEAYTLARVGG